MGHIYRRHRKQQVDFELIRQKILLIPMNVTNGTTTETNQEGVHCWNFY